jgi:hypothetical protein
MKQKLSILLLCASLLQAAPNEELATDKKNVKKVTRNNRSQVLTDLTRITLGVGCCVAAAVCARNSYDAYNACCTTTEPKSIARKAIESVDLRPQIKTAWNWSAANIWNGVNAVKTRWEAFRPRDNNFNLSNWYYGAQEAQPNAAGGAVNPNPEPVTTPVSPRILTKSPFSLVASNDFYANFAKSVGWGTSSLITGVVGLKLVAQGLHIGDLFATKNKEIDEEENN